MTITYTDGKTLEAVLLSRSLTEDTMRLAVEGADDVMEVVNIHGTWVTQDCEPVSIRYAWERRGPRPEITEDDCICSRELASRLIHSLFAGSNEATRKTDAPRQAEPLIGRLGLPV